MNRTTEYLLVTALVAVLALTVAHLATKAIAKSFDNYANALAAAQQGN